MVSCLVLLFFAGALVACALTFPECSLRISHTPRLPPSLF